MLIEKVSPPLLQRSFWALRSHQGRRAFKSQVLFVYKKISKQTNRKMLLRNDSAKSLHVPTKQKLCYESRYPGNINAKTNAVIKDLIFTIKT